MAVQHSITAQHQGLERFGRIQPRVYEAIETASRQTGVDFDYLLHKAGTESSFKADAKAKTSSATGLFQFLDNTWLDMVKRHGAKYGLSKEASAIQTSVNGRLTVSDTAEKKNILNLRNNPEISSYMAAEFAKDNQSVLERNITGRIGRTDLYLAHFMGASGASEFLQAKQTNPNAYGADLFPQAAKSNAGVFYTGDGQKRTLNDIYQFFSNKFNQTQSVKPVQIAKTPNTSNGYSLNTSTLNRPSHVPARNNLISSKNLYITMMMHSQFMKGLDLL